MLKSLGLAVVLLLHCGCAVAYEAMRIASGLTAPVALADPGDGSGRLFVVEQHGLVRTMDRAGIMGPDLLDLRGRLLPLREDFEERGLLGFALHPDFAVNGQVYVSYSAPLRAGAPSGWNHTRRISELTLAPGATAIDLASERVLLELDWPSRKHNGGGLGFGVDGFLYIGLGDGGGVHGVGPETLWSAFETPAHAVHWDRLAQDVTTLFGKVLRIDVDRGFPGYGVPPGNPFAGGGGRPEIFALGFRNPYRFGMDRLTGAITVTAVAETLWEAVYLIDGPGNFGWPVREGTHCVDRLKPRTPPGDCAEAGAEGWRFRQPVVEYANMQVMHPESGVQAEGIGTAVTGAVIYRGSAAPELRGKLIFTDWSRDFMKPSGQVFAARPADGYGDLWPFEKLAELDTRIIGLAEDAEGELYILTNDQLGPFGQSGQIYRLEP